MVGGRKEGRKEAGAGTRWSEEKAVTVGKVWSVCITSLNGEIDFVECAQQGLSIASWATTATKGALTALVQVGELRV
ncbi:unnamed protein product [Calypogeia fissa]